jgi:hypothetical protein
MDRRFRGKRRALLYTYDCSTPLMQQPGLSNRRERIKRKVIRVRRLDVEGSYLRTL